MAKKMEFSLGVHFFFAHPVYIGMLEITALANAYDCNATDFMPSYRTVIKDKFLEEAKS